MFKINKIIIGLILVSMMGSISTIFAEPKIEKFKNTQELSVSLIMGKECWFGGEAQNDGYANILMRDFVLGDNSWGTEGTYKIISIKNLLNYLDPELRIKIEARVVSNIDTWYTQNMVFNKNTYMLLLEENKQDNYLIFGSTNEGTKIYLINYTGKPYHTTSGYAALGQCDLAKLIIKNTDLFKELNLNKYQMKN